ncbi:MAG: conjugal transfer protein TrbF [Gammaproteobacteria bacterium]
MRFRRSSIRYSTTLAPATPYQAAQQLWDERIGSARVQAKNWRLMAFGSLTLSFVIIAALIWQTGRSTITPYVVEVDRQGDVRAVGAAVEAYRPTDAQIAYHLSRFLRNVRSLPIDPIVLRENWLEAYDYTTDRAGATLNEYARANDPFARVGRTSVAIEVTSVVRASGASFQVRWIERTYVNGSPSTTEHWTAILSIVLEPPRDAVRIRKNPLGIYVDGLDWSRELAAG